MHFKKYEVGWNHASSILSVLQHKDSSDPSKMLALRCICNMFKESSAVFTLQGKREKVVEAVSGHFSNGKANIRESAITVMLNYSICFLMKDDPEGRI